ncbi:MAG: type I DNA topoisomerase [Clostridiales bacterium]|nr:type I DNA topoisomerase [Clostridiales bacterium]
MAKLVIVESPSKANTIKGYLGKNYEVVASVGHVRDLPKSTLGVDIENHFTPKYINIRGKGDVIKALKKDAKKADDIFLATDSDREGEAIAWHLATLLGIEAQQAKRVTFNEITKKVVKDGIKNPRPIDMNLVNSQQTRRILDRIVGYKLSPFLWKTVRSGLSAGRVQSVATRIIVEREKEIEKFVPEEYWSLLYTLITQNKEEIKFKFYGDQNGKIALKNEEETQAVIEKTKNNPFSITSVKKAVKHRSPQPPYITSTLQQDAYNKLGFQSARIMRVAQELYEGIALGKENGGTQGLITYMRTDSMRISDEAAGAAENYIRTVYGDDYYPDKRRVFKAKEDAQDAHEAIRPTSLAFEPAKIKKYLSQDQYKLYLLIWNRFLASQMADALLDTMQIDAKNNGYLFKASGYTVRFQGYQVLYKEEKETDLDKGALPAVQEKESLTIKEILPEQHFTEPPARYNDATLIRFLKEKGIGRPSTYTQIITTILSRGYVTREKKAFKPTALGEITTQIMIEQFPEIVNYEFTAQMENDLDEVENGKAEGEKVLTHFYERFEKELETALQSVSKDDIEIPVEETDIVCEKCGAKMVIKSGRFGKFAACPRYPECKNTKPLDQNGNPVVKEEKEPKPTGEKCEKCGADMVIRAGRYGDFIACSNYPTCKNTKQIANEIGVPCPVCGGKILLKHGKKRTVFYSCEHYPTCDFSSWDLPLAKSCPDCGQMLYMKKNKNLIVCKNKECNYKEETETESEQKI